MYQSCHEQHHEICLQKRSFEKEINAPLTPEGDHSMQLDHNRRWGQYTAFHLVLHTFIQSLEL